MIGIIKTKDLRNYYLTNLLKDYNFIYSDDINDFFNVKILIIPPLGINSDYYFRDSNINIYEILKQNPGIKKIITCLGSKELKTFCSINSIELIILYDIEDIVYKNSILTSEGLLKVILNDLDNISLGDLKILVLGYGYCGYCIVKDLSNFNNDIYVYAKDYHDLKTIYMSGFNKVEELTNLNEFDIIINTIPYNIVNLDVLKTISDNTLIYDISSYPYGFDLVAAKDLNIKVDILPGIPGKMLARSASKVIYEEIIKYIN